MICTFFNPRDKAQAGHRSLLRGCCSTAAQAIVVSMSAAMGPISNPGRKGFARLHPCWGSPIGHVGVDEPIGGSRERRTRRHELGWLTRPKRGPPFPAQPTAHASLIASLRSCLALSCCTLVGQFFLPCWDSRLGIPWQMVLWGCLSRPGTSPNQENSALQDSAPSNRRPDHVACAARVGTETASDMCSRRRPRICLIKPTTKWHEQQCVDTKWINQWNTCRCSMILVGSFARFIYGWVQHVPRVFENVGGYKNQPSQISRRIQNILNTKGCKRIQ